MKGLNLWYEGVHSKEGGPSKQSHLARLRKLPNSCYRRNLGKDTRLLTETSSDISTNPLKDDFPKIHGKIGRKFVSDKKLSSIHSGGNDEFQRRL